MEVIEAWDIFGQIFKYQKRPMSWCIVMAEQSVPSFS
jgi:hypothetical protein